MFFNWILFNLMWLGCVFYGNIFAPFVLTWAVVYVCVNRAPIKQLLFIASVTFFGAFVDTMLMHAGFIQFPNQGQIIPFWLAMMWLSFALTINGCLSLLKHTPALQWLFGLIFAPLAYWAGINLSDASFGHPMWLTMIVIGILWSLMMLLFFGVNQRLNKAESFA
ncbi:DUF2878 domain-containing protein [Parashewanella tropica]|uniref:DUF2878 domain-containing protein n=1 Tax=Parashewanella tropica TaxID=2547970 RepID=UPI00105A65BA|nr:DUF2878 domain-containing protein [Parashewanella tropica]